MHLLMDAGAMLTLIFHPSVSLSLRNTSALYKTAKHIVEILSRIISVFLELLGVTDIGTGSPLTGALSTEG